MTAEGPITDPDVPALETFGSEQVAEIFRLLLKGIKTINLYRHDPSRFEEYLKPTHHALQQFLEACGSLPLKLGPFTLQYEGEVIYEDQDKENLTYKFYRDGMRYLIFREDLPVDELLKFVLLAMENVSQRSLFQEDMITRLWKLELRYIEYIVVEGFAFGDLADDEVEIEVEKIVGYLRKQLAANSEDVTRFARLSLEDLELELSDIDQVRGGIVSGRPATKEDHEWVQQELYYEEKQRLFAKMVLILFQVLELDSSESDFELLRDSFAHVLDTLLLSEDVKGSVALLERFKAMQKKPMAPARLQLLGKIVEHFRRLMVETQRLESVGQYLALSKELDERAVKAYLSACSKNEVDPLVAMLSRMERSEGRRILVDVLAKIGKDSVNVFARHLLHNSSNMVRDMLAVIEQINPPNRVNLTSKCLVHPNMMIRLAALTDLARAPGMEAVHYIEKALEDENLQIRLAAYRCLASRVPERAAPILISIMRADDYHTKDPRECLSIATALGETKTGKALGFLSSVFKQKTSLFGRARLVHLKKSAIVGLGAHGSVAAFKVLAEEVENRNNSKEVLEAAHKMALRLKLEIEKVRGRERG